MIRSERAPGSGRPVTSRRGLGPALLLTAPLLVLTLGFFVPLGYMAAVSLMKYDPIFLIKQVFTFENYVEIASDQYVLGLLARTIRISLLSSLVALVVGFPLALHLVRSRGIERSIITLILLSPMTVSLVILGYAWQIMLLPNSGVVPNLLRSLGVTNPPQLMFTELGVILALAHYNLILMVFNLQAALQAIDPLVLRASQSLGASSLRTFLSVTVPLALPGIFSGTMVVFATTSGTLMIPLMIGGRRVPILATYVYDLSNYALNWPAGAAAGMTILLVSTGTVIAYTWLVGRTSRRARAG